MRFDFDRVIDRRETGSEKWDGPSMQYGRDDLLPLWVADMDFAVPPEVVEAIKRRADHPIFGYPTRPNSALEALSEWVKVRHGWQISTDWIRLTNGVVTALDLAVLSFANRGDKVIIQTPVYGPFFRVVTCNGCQVVTNPLKLIDGRYVMDFDDLESKLDDRVKMIILCNPHNPVGRVWTERELIRLGDICIRHNILIISDDVHSDFVFKGHRYTPIASLSEQFQENTITCMAPSKTFNLAGLATAAVIIPNKRLRQTFTNTMQNVGVATGIFGVTAMEAAYRHGHAWLDELLVYLQGNLEFLCEFIKEHIPQVQVIKPEGTYLVWLDFRRTGISPDRLQEFMVQQAGVVLNEGLWFGEDGAGFMRMNIGCPRSILKEGLTRIEQALKRLPPQR